MITPNEALKQNEDAPEAIQLAESCIDSALVRYDGTHAVTVSVRRLGLSQKGRDMMIARYEDAGWGVKYVSDQRDGDYWEFQGRRGRDR